MPAGWWVPPRAAPAPAPEAGKDPVEVGRSQKGRCFSRSVCDSHSGPDGSGAAAKNTLVGAGGSLAQVTAPDSHPSHSPSGENPTLSSGDFQQLLSPPPNHPTLPRAPRQPHKSGQVDTEVKPRGSPVLALGLDDRGAGSPPPSPPQLEDAWKSSIRAASLPLRDTASHGVTRAASSCPQSPPRACRPGRKPGGIRERRPSTHGGLL